MNDIIIVDVEKVCRGCLSDNSDTFESLHQSNRAEIFNLCTNVEITDFDNMPRNICSNCIFKCESWYSFRELCQQTDKTLRKHFIVKSENINLTEFNQCDDNETKPPEFVETPNNHYINDLNLKNEKFKQENHEKSPLDDDLNEEDHYSSCSSSRFSDEDVEFKQKKTKRKIETKQTKSQKIKSEFCCDMCKKTFRNGERLEAHMRQHLGQKPEVCKICSKEFNNLRALRRHKLKHFDLKQYACQECGKTYKYATSLTLHKKVHQDIRRFVCDLCGKSFVRAHGLQSHLLSHSTETPFPCDLCDKRFKNQIMLKNHQMRHNGIKKFVCSECGKSFTTSAELTTHSRTHTGVKPFECTMCDKRYKTKSHLAVHVRTHTGARPYKCDLCPQTFAHNKVLKQHRLTHTGERPHSCEICQRPFRQKSTLKVHMRTHKQLTVQVLPQFTPISHLQTDVSNVPLMQTQIQQGMNMLNHINPRLGI